MVGCSFEGGVGGKRKSTTGIESLPRQRYPFVALRRAAVALQHVLMPQGLAQEMAAWRGAVAAKATGGVPQGLDAWKSGTHGTLGSRPKFG